MSRQYLKECKLEQCQIDLYSELTSSVDLRSQACFMTLLIQQHRCIWWDPGDRIPGIGLGKGSQYTKLYTSYPTHLWTIITGPNLNLHIKNNSFQANGNSFTVIFQIKSTTFVLGDPEFSPVGCCSASHSTLLLKGYNDVYSFLK